MENRKIKNHLLKIIGSRFLYFVAGMLIVSTVVVYAAWSDAQTAGSGKLTELNWNSLVTQLQTIPTNVVRNCAYVSAGSYGASSIATCGGGQKVVSGGCRIGLASSVATSRLDSSPASNSTWGCNWVGTTGVETGGGTTMASAICCDM